MCLYATAGGLHLLHTFECLPMQFDSLVPVARGWEGRERAKEKVRDKVAVRSDPTQTRLPWGFFFNKVVALSRASILLSEYESVYVCVLLSIVR